MLATLLWLACQAKVEPVAASPAPAAAPDAPPPAAPPAPASAPPCGGFAGFRCPEDLTCVDDTTDACHPGRGMDCIGVCVACDDPRLAGRRTLGDPATCATLRFACEPGEAPVHDPCGCGCAPAPAPPAPPAGN